MLRTLIQGLFGGQREKARYQRATPIQPPESLPTLAEVDQMDGKSFEAYLAGLFSCLGYEIERTPHYDQGADLVLIRDGVRTAVQAKRWKGEVDVHAVRAIIASMRSYDCSQAMVVTNSSAFTLPARKCARDNGVKLWGRRQLAEVLAHLGVEPQPGPPPQSRRYTCHRCGEGVTEKAAGYCLSQHDRFGGQVYCYKHQRKGYKSRAS